MTAASQPKLHPSLSPHRTALVIQDPSLYVVDSRLRTVIPLRRRALPPDARHQDNGAEHHHDAEAPDDEVYRGHGFPLSPLLPYGFRPRREILYSRRVLPSACFVSPPQLVLSVRGRCDPGFGGAWAEWKPDGVLFVRVFSGLGVQRKGWDGR